MSKRRIPCPKCGRLISRGAPMDSHLATHYGVHWNLGNAHGQGRPQGINRRAIRPRP